jgi:hypothetical protein
MMTRKISISTMVLGLLGAAFAAVPVAAETTGTLPSPDLYLAQIAPGSQAETEGLTTPDTYLAQRASADDVAVPSSSTPDAYLAQRGLDTGPVPSGMADVGSGGSADGFDWLDALVGGLIALAVMLLAFAAAHRFGRFPRATHESRA